MKTVRQIIHPLAIALVLIYFQLNYYFPFSLRMSPHFTYPIILNAIILGIVFGLLGCPGCSLPLSFSLTLWHDKLKKITLPLFVFSVSRLLSIFFYSVAGNIGLSAMKSLSPKYMFVISGVIMIAFGIIILKGLSLHPSFAFNKCKNLIFIYAIWGFVLGFPCGFEATGFLAYLWNYPAPGAVKYISLLLF